MWGLRILFFSLSEPKMWAMCPSKIIWKIAQDLHMSKSPKFSTWSSQTLKHFPPPTPQLWEKEKSGLLHGSSISKRIISKYKYQLAVTINMLCMKKLNYFSRSSMKLAFKFAISAVAYVVANFAKVGWFNLNFRGSYISQSIWESRQKTVVTLKYLLSLKKGVILFAFLTDFLINH